MSPATLTPIDVVLELNRMAAALHPYAPEPKLLYAMRSYGQMTSALQACAARNGIACEKGQRIDEPVVAALDVALRGRPVAAPSIAGVTVDRPLLERCQELVERVLLFSGEHPDPAVRQLQHELAGLLAASAPLSTPQYHEND